jgi:hypothetical protein
MKPLLTFLTLGFVLMAQASDTSLTKTQVELKVPYTFGVHTVEATKLTGQVFWNNDKTQILEADLVLAVTDLTNDDKTFICHLQSSLTLDYTQSDFPKEHVCEDDALPPAGKNSPKHTTITAHLVAPFTLGDKSAKILWTIHGVSREQNVPVVVTLNEDKTQYTLKGEWKMKRSDFDITVKKFLFIDADNKLPVSLHLEGAAK